MTVTHNPKAAADQARAAYRKTTDHARPSRSRHSPPRGLCAHLPRRLWRRPALLLTVPGMLSMHP